MSATFADVYCNIYDMTDHNNYTYPLGFGVFHSAIQVHGREYSYGGHDFHSSGIFDVQPKTELSGTRLRKSIKLGTTRLTARQVDTLILEMGSAYSGKFYHILSKNCNHFTDDFARRLCEDRKGFPSWDPSSRVCCRCGNLAQDQCNHHTPPTTHRPQEREPRPPPQV